MLDKNTVNRVILMGRVAQEPRWLSMSGQRCIIFELITEERIKKGAESLVHEERHTVRINEMHVPAEALNKGAIVYVQGRLQTKMSLDEKMAKHYRTEISANSVEIIEPAFADNQI